MKRVLTILTMLTLLLMLRCAALGEEEAYQSLKYGDKGETVLALQTRLKELLYYNGPLSGEFGDLTRKAVRRVEAAYRNSVGWARMAMMNTFSSGKFSSDRTIEEYVQDIWHLDKINE